MGGTRIRHDFESLASRKSELKKASLDPNGKAEQGNGSQAPDEDATEGNDTPTISVYQDPRDELDFERHQIGGIGSRHHRD